MRDWRDIKAAIGDRVFCVSAGAAHGPAILEAWVEEVNQTRVPVRTAARPFGGGDWLRSPRPGRRG